MKNQITKTIILLCILNFTFCIYSTAQIQQNNVRVVDTVFTPAGYPGGPLPPSILWLPSVTNGAAVILVHGTGGSPDDLHLMGDILSSYGYVVLSMDYYAFANPFGVPSYYPAPVRAIKTAVEFLRKNSLLFGNFTNKIACIGNSEGAQQTARTIIWDNDDAYFGTDATVNDHIDAAVLFYGLYDYYNHLESLFNNPGLEDIITDYYSLNPANRAGKGNPFTNINNITSPILMLHGTADRIVEVAQSIEFRDSLVAHGKTVQLELIPGADHVFEFHNSHPLQNFNWNQWSALGEISRDTVLAWLARTLQVNNIHCPYAKSYWKNHSALWNADAIPMMLGTTNSYNKMQLLAILNSNSGDVSIKLAQNLISAKLNVANNSYAPPIVTTITTADNLIGARAIPVVPAVASNSTQGNQMTALGNILQSYNNGSMTPNCSNRLAGNNSDNNNFSFNIFPNPFSNSTTISFSLSQQEKVSVKVFDITGRIVKTLAEGEMQEGIQQIEWHATDEKGNAVDGGIYFLKLETENYSETKKFSVVK